MFGTEVIKNNLATSFIIFKTNAHRINEQSDQVFSCHSGVYPNHSVAELL